MTWLRGFPRASTAVLRHDTDWEVKGHFTPSLVETERKSVLILTPEGRDATRVYVGIGPWDKLLNFRARVVPFETWAQYTDGDPNHWDSWALDSGMYEVLNKYTALESTPIWWEVDAIPSSGYLYTDSRVRIFDVPGGAVGRVLEYEYTVEHSLLEVAPEVRLVTDTPVWKRTVNLSLRRGFGVRVSERAQGVRVASSPPTPQKRGLGRTGYSWSWSKLEPFEDEPFSPPIEWLVPSLRLTFHRLKEGKSLPPEEDWKHLNQWYLDLVRDHYDLPSGEANRVLSQMPAPLRQDALRGLYYFVRDQIRYVATHEGLGAFRPHPAREVLDARFGDCKDKATLLISLYRQYGLNAWPVWIGVQPSRPFELDMADLASFDHEIVAVELNGQLHFVDPTAESAAFERLPVQDQGRDVVVLRPEGPQMLRTPTAEPEANALIRRWTLDVARHELSLELSAEGSPAGPYRGLWLGDRSGEAMRGYLKSLVGSLPTSMEVVDPTEDERSPFRLNARFEASGLLTRVGQDDWITLSDFFFSYSEVRIPTKRLSPVTLGSPRQYVEHLTVVLPQGYRARIPANHEETFSWGQHSRQCETVEQTVRCRRELTFRTVNGQEIELAELRRMSEGTLSDSRQSIVVSGGVQ